MSPQVPPPEVALTFLRGLEPEGPWLLVAINPFPDENGLPKAVLGEFGPADAERCGAWIERWNQSHNLYYTSNLPRSGPFVTAKKEAVEWVRVLHVDLDLPGAATDEALREELLARVRALDPAPSAIVFTGGGYQALWKLAERLAAAEAAERIERINTAIWTTLNGDHCHDVSRLLRLPGTVNRPNAKKRAKGRVEALAEIVEADWTRTWSLARDPVPRLPEAPAADAGQLPGPGDPVDQSGNLEGLPPKLRKLILSGDAQNFRDDRSRLGWFVVCALLRLRWSDEDVKRVLLNPRYGVSAHFLEQPDRERAVQRTLARAHETLAEDWERAVNGAILTRSQRNVNRALDELGIRLTHNLLSDTPWVNGAGPLQRLADPVLDAMWLKTQERFDFLPEKDFFATVVRHRAREAAFHPVLEYLAAVEPTWDGVERLGHRSGTPSWLTTYGSVPDTEYTRAVGRLTLVAAVRRMRNPGCKFDEMLLLVDPTQGTNKSQAVQTLAVREDWYSSNVTIGAEGREAIEQIRGFWILECAEMTGLSSRELERIKGYCSTQTDRGRMSYDRLITEVPRCCVFIGTTNEEKLFVDMANRRFWPVRVLAEFDLVALRLYRDQLWAEAAQAETRGESIRLDRDLWPIAAEEQAKYRVEDTWATLLDQCFGHLNGRITSPDLYRLISKQVGNTQHLDGKRLSRAMKEIGFEHRQLRTLDSPNPRWYYARGTEAERLRDLYVLPDPVTGIYAVGHHPTEPPEPMAEDQRPPRQPRDPGQLPF